MIVYATKQTVERYGIKMPEDFQDPIMSKVVLDVYNGEKGNPLLEWGAKIFYFDHRKCIQICNFASKLTIVLVDIKKSDLKDVGNLIIRYLMEIYSDNEKMLSLIERYYKEHPLLCFTKLTDRRIISTMNSFQRIYLNDGYRLYKFIENNIIKTIDMNRKINSRYMVTDKIDGKTEYYYPVNRFEKLLIDYYK